MVALDANAAASELKSPLREWPTAREIAQLASGLGLSTLHCVRPTDDADYPEISTEPFVIETLSTAQAGDTKGLPFSVARSAGEWIAAHKQPSSLDKVAELEAEAGAAWARSTAFLAQVDGRFVLLKPALRRSTQGDRVTWQRVLSVLAGQRMPSVDRTPIREVFHMFFDRVVF